MQGQFQAAAFNDLEKANKNEYVNARYAPIGDEKVGMPFPLFRQPAGYFTDWTSSGQTTSNYRRRLNLPTDNTLMRNTIQADGVSLANNQNSAFVFRTQTLVNNGDPIACVNDTDCESWPGTTCNRQYMSWNDAKGNQGNYCAVTKYPEMENGVYNRKTKLQGGIGKECRTDRECAVGYYCNNQTDIFGKNVQQNGFCSQVYQCQGTTHYLGYPNNSSVPLAPPPEQNNNGRGYDSKKECNNSKLAQQDCVRGNTGKWFATYPGYCPVVTNLRSDSKPAGALPSSNISTVDKGIVMPGYASNLSSTSFGPISSKGVQPASSWSSEGSLSTGNRQMSEPMAYELSINPR